VTTPSTPAELIAQAAARHQAARDATARIAQEVAETRRREADDQAAARAAQESGR
jgi:hypothetical protein